MPWPLKILVLRTSSNLHDKNAKQIDVEKYKKSCMNNDKLIIQRVETSNFTCTIIIAKYSETMRDKIKKTGISISITY